MRMYIKIARFFVFFVIAYLQVPSSYAAVITVTNAGDSGVGTLRDAITLNAGAGDIIRFASAFTINLASPILINKANITIDATTVSGWSASANKVTITGNGSVTNAFFTQTFPNPAPNLTIKGIMFTGFTGTSIILQDASAFLVTNCWFGLAANGTTVIPHTGACISIKGTSSYGNIGRSNNPLERNIFMTTSATANTCINLNNTGVSLTNLIKIQGNYFGTNYAGSTILGLGVNSGIRINGSGSGYVLIGGPGVNDGNLIDGCASGSAINFAAGANFNFTIQGNKIGTLATNSNYNGILLGSDNTSFTIQGNTINNSQNYGIVFPGGINSQVKISQNSFSSNVGGGINSSITPSNINAATPFKVVGNASAGTANATVEIYSWDGLGSTSGQGTNFIASVTADATGAWFYYGSFTIGQKLVITTTPLSGNPATTTFSPPFTVTSCPSTVSAVTGTPTICATTSSVNMAGSGSFITAPYSWSVVSGGTGTLTNATTLSPTYNLSAAELNNTTAPILVSLSLTVGTNTCQPTISSLVTITINPKPTANAGADNTVCASTTSVTLNGSITTATGGTWTGGGGTYLPNANTLNATYTPTASERTLGAVNLTLSTTGNGLCTAVSDLVKIGFSPIPTVDAGIDRTICELNSNIIVSGTITNAPAGTWSTSGNGTFSNANNLTTVYTPSNADKAAGSVTLRLASSGGSCTSVSDLMVLTINPCLIDPQLAFQSPTVYVNSGSTPFKHNFTPLNSTGKITYDVKNFSTLGASACATIDADGFVTTNCVETVLVTAYQAAKGPYDADTAKYIMYIGKAITKIKLESRGSIVLGDDFRLLVKTNYDAALTYAVVGGDGAAISMTTDGLISPLAVGTVYVRATAAANANFETGYSNDAVITIYPKRTKPVAVNDTLDMSIAEEKTIDIGVNDYGTTASVNISPSMLLDIDEENAGVQNKFFKPGIGIFTVDTVGVLTFTAFDGFIGTENLVYTITDADGIESDPALVVINVTSPVSDIALKANEVITANQDNINDVLVIGYTDLTLGNDLLVVDAAGNRLFYESNYQNNWGATTQSGNNLDNGVYYFIFREFNSGGSVKRELRGNFTVIR